MANTPARGSGRVLLPCVPRDRRLINQYAETFDHRARRDEDAYYIDWWPKKTPSAGAKDNTMNSRIVRVNLT